MAEQSVFTVLVVDRTVERVPKPLRGARQSEGLLQIGSRFPENAV